MEQLIHCLHNKIEGIWNRLESKEDFLTIAEKYLIDPAAKKNKGDIGYITVFNLPYEFGNTLPALPFRKNFKLYRSKAGYHIIKFWRKESAGKIKVQQILLAFPPESTDAARKAIANADSIYLRLLKGDNFESSHRSSATIIYLRLCASSVADITVGEFEPAYENFVFALPKDSAIGKPFLTTHGYHIVKRVNAYR